MGQAEEQYRVHIQTQEKIVAFYLDDHGLHIHDQRALPQSDSWLHATELEDVARAIEELAVRGAPAIGGVAALALALVAKQTQTDDLGDYCRTLEAAHLRLSKTRPTAVNLFYVLSRMRSRWISFAGEIASLREILVVEAEAICRADAAACEQIGQHGAQLIEDGDVILTICHTGALATCGQGTALGILRTAYENGKSISVIALETRPLLQGARLTAWECIELGIPVELVTDGMAAFAMARKGITKAMVGADRIARNADVANKIGTYGVAQLCRAHGIPFYVAAPTSTFDDKIRSGDDIPIEERHPDEIRCPRGTPFAPPMVPVWNPAFDVTPASLISGIVTEQGIWPAPFASQEWPA
jgi:methylthioribose-1-phosphate isomerase